MGGSTTPSRAVVQSAGLGYRLNAPLPITALKLGGPVMNLLLRYTQALITQMSQTAGCNRHHSLDEQLCRWLLLSLDRLPGSRPPAAARDGGLRPTRAALDEAGVQNTKNGGGTMRCR